LAEYAVNLGHHICLDNMTVLAEQCHYTHGIIYEDIAVSLQQTFSREGDI
jgi:hypothetical protein